MDPQTMNPVLQAICRLLDSGGIAYRRVQHEPTRTSEDSARARGEELRTGGKALLMKADDEFCLFVVPADRRADSAAIRRELAVRKLRFATADELAAETGLVPGSVPPFGRPVLPFRLYVDAAVTENERIAFNAGSLTESIIMSAADYLAAASPERVFGFSKLAADD
ncbi:MAG: hypothetical protein KY476_19490 [Planctomycetes bacterium]|nr:hypothetical protein [Planctomycetota bacterium]